jgi:methyltransferase (TIGR00027 family)
MPSNNAVNHVSDTALWVAMYRAMETDRADALFRDPLARKLAGPRGEEILRVIPKAKQFAWPMIVRTAVMDEVILRVVRDEGADMVLNLASGLDTRPYRLALPRALRWVEADFPDLQDYKDAHLGGEQPRCALERERVDLTDAAARNALFQRLGGSARRVLVIAEGLLIYLTPEQVAGLARDLYAQPSFHWWLMDIAHPRLLTMMERTWGKALRAGNAPFIFAPAESTAFFQPHGWEESAFRPMFEESIRLKRTFPMARFWRWVMRFYPRKLREQMKRFSGVALLSRARTP